MSAEKIGVRVLGDPSAFAGASEHAQQVALFAAIAQYADYFERLGNGYEAGSIHQIEALRTSNALRWIHAVPNGGSRGENPRSAKIQGSIMKAEGLKRGIYDIAINVARHGYHGFDIEMKKPGTIGERRDGRSAEQVEYGDWLSSEARLGSVFDDWREALKAIKWYLGIEAHPFKWEL